MKGIPRTLSALAVALAMLPGTLVAGSAVATGGETLRGSAAVDFRIDVPRVMRMRLLNHPAALQITREDIDRGHLRVKGAALDIAANDRHGYLIRADLSVASFTGLRIDGLASTCEGDADGCVVRMPSMVGNGLPAPVHVVYELRLDPHMEPGRYPWPVALSLQQP